MEFLLGALLGSIATGVVFIVFGKNNKSKIAKARQEIIDVYEDVSNEIDDEAGKIIRNVKDRF